MVYLYLRIALMLIMMLFLAVVVVLVAPYDNSRLHTFMAAPEFCRSECLLGIRTGTTTVGEALQQLQTHAWVERVLLSAPGTGYGQVRWLWSGRQPDFIDDSSPGRITFYWDDEENAGRELDDIKVDTISIYTRIRMTTLQNRLGTPDSGTAAIRLDGSLGYAAAYHIRGSTVSLSTILPCPANLLAYWNAATKVTLSIGYGTSQYVPPTEMVKVC